MTNVLRSMTVRERVAAGLALVALVWAAFAPAMGRLWAQTVAIPRPPAQAPIVVQYASGYTLGFPATNAGIHAAETAASNIDVIHVHASTEVSVPLSQSRIWRVHDPARLTNTSNTDPIWDDGSSERHATFIGGGYDSDGQDRFVTHHDDSTVTLRSVDATGDVFCDGGGAFYILEGSRVVGSDDGSNNPPGGVIYCDASSRVDSIIAGVLTPLVAAGATGSGQPVYSISPALTTPSLGVASATSVNKVAITAPASSATLTVANGKTFTASNTLTLTGTDGSTLNVGAGGTLNAGAVATLGTGVATAMGATPNAANGLVTIDGSGNTTLPGNLGVSRVNTSNGLSLSGTFLFADGITGAGVNFTDGSGATGASSMHIGLRNVYTNTSNYERGGFKWTSNVFRVGTENAGTGTARDLSLVTGGTVRATIGGTTGIVSFEKPITLVEQAADPSDPAEGQSAIWQSEGTGAGDDGDIMVKVTAGGVTKTITLIDFSAF